MGSVAVCNTQQCSWKKTFSANSNHGDNRYLFFFKLNNTGKHKEENEKYL